MQDQFLTMTSKENTVVPESKDTKQPNKLPKPKAGKGVGGKKRAERYSS